MSDCRPEPAQPSGLVDSMALGVVDKRFVRQQNAPQATMIRPVALRDARSSVVAIVSVNRGDGAAVPSRIADTPNLNLYGGAAAPMAVRTTNEPPTLTGTTNIDYVENGKEAVATYTATDPEGETITWTVTGADAGVFSITAGVLEFVTSPNYENPVDENEENQYGVSVSATDLSGASATIEVAVNVTDTNDPNIVLIMADDVGYEAFGAYGSTQYRTPRIDELAAAGVRLTNTYSKPVCTPSRVALMTGKSNVRNYADFEVLLPGQYTFADLFREAGYATAIAGKWQLHGGPRTLTGVAAAETGFDTYCLWNTANTNRRRYWRPSIECDGEIIDSNLLDYGPEVFADFLLEFIESNQHVPFFVYYPMVLPHYPFDSPPDAQCADTDDEQCNFEDMVAYMDRNVGRIYDRLDTLELLTNTIVLFTSDNGSHRTVVSTLLGETIHGDKGLPTDGGTRVPLVVRVPGGQGGRVLDDLVDFTDFLPTLADAASLTIPEGMTLDGVSFWERLKGNSGRPRQWIYTYYFPKPYVAEFDNPSNYPEVAYVRDKRHKLDSSGDLFDISSDRHEIHPLPKDDEATVATRTTLQAVLDSMPDRGEEIRSSSVAGVVSTAEPRPLWRPVLKTAKVSGTELTLVYAGILNTSIEPSADAYTVKVDETERTVSGVSLADTAVSLTLAVPVTAAQTVTLSYAPGTNALRHGNRSSGHKAAALADEPVENETPADSTDPTVESIATDATHPTRNPFTATIGFSEPVTGLDSGEITVVNGTGSNLSGVRRHVYATGNTGCRLRRRRHGNGPCRCGRGHRRKPQ